MQLLYLLRMGRRMRRDVWETTLIFMMHIHLSFSVGWLDRAVPKLPALLGVTVDR